MANLFLPDAESNRPCNGGHPLFKKPHFKDCLRFHEVRSFDLFAVLFFQSGGKKHSIFMVVRVADAEQVSKDGLFSFSLLFDALAKTDPNEDMGFFFFFIVGCLEILTREECSFLAAPKSW
jgi:hypothetical protein